MSLPSLLEPCCLHLCPLDDHNDQCHIHLTAYLSDALTNLFYSHPPMSPPNSLNPIQAITPQSPVPHPLCYSPTPVSLSILVTPQSHLLTSILVTTQSSISLSFLATPQLHLFPFILATSKLPVLLYIPVSPQAPVFHKHRLVLSLFSSLTPLILQSPVFPSIPGDPSIAHTPCFGSSHLE